MPVPSVDSRSAGLKISETMPDYMRGLSAEASRDWYGARTFFARAALERPGDDEAILAQARTLHAQGHAWEAASMLESFARSGLASAQLLKATGDAITAAGSPGMALPYYRQVWEMRSTDPSARIDYAAALYGASRYEDVLEVFETVAVEDMSLSELLVLGRSALMTRAGDVAAGVLVRYVTAEPDDPSVWLDLARAELMRSQPHAALEALRPVVKADPRSKEAALLLGHIHAQTGKIQAALDAYGVAVKLGVSEYDLIPIMKRLRARNDSWVAKP
jgi:Flp pilus assembly protein TadD